MVEANEFVDVIVGFVADDNSVGVEEVVDCGALCQELGVARDHILVDVFLDRNLSNDLADHLGSPDGHG